MIRDIPKLSTGQVHVWLARTSPLASRTEALLATVLDHDERTRLSRFAAALHRRQYVVGRGLLRMLLGAYLDCEPQAIEFEYGPFGRPEIRDGRAAEALRFNVAHSGEMVLLAFAADMAIGVDVERVVDTLDWLDVARHTCTSREIEAVTQYAPAMRVQQFLSIWTRREAFVKATGHGLRALTEDLELPAASDGWSVIPLDAGDGYAAALAAQASGFDVMHFTWTDENDDTRFREYAVADGAHRL